MLSTSERYALLAVIHLGSHPDTWFTGREIAKGLNLPSDYLIKLLMQLAQKKILDARRGRGGGFKFRKESGDLSIPAVLEAVSHKELMEDCLLGTKACGSSYICRLHALLKPVMDKFRETLAGCSLKELLPADPE